MVRFSNAIRRGEFENEYYGRRRFRDARMKKLRTIIDAIATTSITHTSNIIDKPTRSATVKMAIATRPTIIGKTNRPIGPGV